MRRGGRDNWGDIGVDGWIILGWIFGWRGCIVSWCENRRERDHWGDLDVGGLFYIMKYIWGEWVYRFLVRKPVGNRPLGDLGVNGWIIL